ncbi:MAG: hypothetical protein J6V99_01410 [Neisseriaceae bacterium]|nr:hypothetical protein [Neisseriaceae bacterium]
MNILAYVLIIIGIALILIALFEDTFFSAFWYPLEALIEWVTVEVIARILPIWDNPTDPKYNYISRIICFVLGLACLIGAWLMMDWKGK